MTAEEGKPTTLGGFAPTEAQLIQRNVPPPRAAVKASNTRAGWVAALIGALMLAASVALALLLVYRREPVPWSVVLLILVFAACGLSTFGLGMTLVTRDAQAVGAAGDLLVRFVHAVGDAIRGNRGEG
jgi:hypothetical protein